MRALGANALLAGTYEGAYGVANPDAFLRLAFVSSALGEERPLIESDLLGFGREMQDPTQDVATNDGDVVVPVDANLFGWWLKLLLGAPVTSVSGTAAADLTFSANPANNTTITLAGTVWTFVSGAPSGNQIQIGANIAATLAAAVAALNASAVPTIAAATYSVVSGNKLHIVNDTAGPVGNGYTVAVSAGSGVTAPANLTGGTNAHVFTSGSSILPTASLEIGMPDIGKYFMNYGGGLNTMKIGLARSGLLNATMSMICQGEADPTAVPSDLTEALITVDRFAQATGSIKKDGALFGEVVAADFAASNNFDKDETIRPDGRINGVDPGMFMGTGSITSKIVDTTLVDLARAGTPFDLSYGWAKGANSLIFDMPRVFLPLTKRPVTGPKGIQAQFNWQASGALGHSVTATLINPQPASIYA